MKKDKQKVVDEKRDGLVNLERHQKVAEKAHRNRSKGGGGGAPSNWV